MMTTVPKSIRDLISSLLPSWSYAELNRGPAACRADALPLSYSPGDGVLLRQGKSRLPSRPPAFPLLPQEPSDNWRALAL